MKAPLGTSPFPKLPLGTHPGAPRCVSMAEQEGADSGVFSRSLGVIRDAVTGQSNGSEQQSEPAETPTAEDETGVTEEAPNEPPERTAEAYAETMQQCADGDLTVRMAPDDGDEAMEQVAVEFNDMVDELENTTSHLKSYVDEVEGAGVSVERSTDTVRRASEDVVDSMQTISADMGDQREQLQATAATLDDVSAALQTFAANHSEADLDAEIAELEAQVSELRDAAATSEAVQSETNIVSAAVEEQAAELSEVSGRASDLQRYAKPLGAMLDRFEVGSDEDTLS